MQDRQGETAEYDARARLRLAQDELALRRELAALRRVASGLGEPEIEGSLRSLEERLDERTLTVIVLGEFNRGKSALINSILGDSWLPCGVAPTTRVVTEVRFGPEERMDVHYPDGVRQRIDRESLAAFTQGAGTAGDQAGDTLPARAVLSLPLPVLRHLTFIDTPGLNDPDTVQAEVIYGLLPRCDVALFILDASFALSLSERTIIGDKLLRASLGRLVFVLSRADELDGPEDEAAVVRRASTLLEPLLGTPPLVLPYSSRDALRGEQGGRNAPLRRLLLEELPAEKTALLLAATRGRAAAAAASLGELSRFCRARLDRAPADLDAELAGLQEREAPRRARLAAALETLSGRLSGLRDEYVTALQRLANNLSETLPAELRAVAPADVRRYLPFYIQDTFRWHLEETLPRLRDAVEAACAMAAGELQDLLAAPGPALPSSIAADAFPLGGRLAPDAWDQGLVASVFIGSVGLLLNPLLASAILVGGPALRLFSLKARREAERAALAADAEKAVFATAEAVAAHIAEAMAAFEAGLGERANAALDAESEAMRTRLEDLRARQLAGAEALNTQREQLDAHLAALDAIRRRLEAMGGEGEVHMNGHDLDEVQA